MCSEGRSKGILVDTICFGKMALSSSWSQIINTTKIGVSAGTGKTENSLFFFEKGCLGVSKRVFYYLWSTQAVLCWKHYFYSVFSKTQLSQRIGCKLPKITKNSGLCFSMQEAWKRCFQTFRFWFLFGFGFCFLVFFAFWKEAPKSHFPAILEGFSLLFPPNPFFKSLFSSCFSSSSSSYPSSFPFVFPFKICLCLFHVLHQPLFRKHPSFFFGGGGSIFLSCFPFPFFMLLLSFKQTSLKSPFSNPSCFHFLAVWLFCCFFCFNLFVFMLSMFVLLLLVVSVVLFSDYEKNWFPCNYCFYFFFWCIVC